MKKRFRALSWILVTAMVLSCSLAGCAGKPGTMDTTLVLGVEEFAGVFSPFYATTQADAKVMELVGLTLLQSGRDGSPTDGAAAYSEPKEMKSSDGTVEKVVYTFRLVDGLQFSDGTPATADDIIFSLLVLCDPYYDGLSSLSTLPIQGLGAYRYDDLDYADKIAEIQRQAEAYIPTDAQISQTAQYLAELYGVDAELLEKDGPYYEAETLPFIRQEQLRLLESNYIEQNVGPETETKVPSVEGIVKKDDRTVEVTLEGVNPGAVWILGGVQLVSSKHYGEGYKKGMLEPTRLMQPIGAGPYTFESYELNVVTLKANPNYYKGAPVIGKVVLQVSTAANKLEGVKLGQFDIADPDANPDMLRQAQDAGLHYTLVDNLGYMYIGINASRVTDVHLRQGLMHLMNRAPAVQTYYGELASVIERPMSSVSWAYPKDAKAMYAFDAQLALACFQQAGYEQTEVNGEKRLLKNGEQLNLLVGINADGTMDHPCAPILTQMKIELELLGGKLEIKDCDGATMGQYMEDNLFDMWVAGWGGEIDPDIYPYFHSNGPANYYHLSNAQIDKLIDDARQTINQSKREAYYEQALDLIMEQAVVMPVYQRKNLYVFNPNTIDISTIAKDQSPYYNWQREIDRMQIIQ